MDAGGGSRKPSIRIGTLKWKAVHSEISGYHLSPFRHEKPSDDFIFLKRLLARFFQTINVPDFKIILQKQKPTDI